MPTQPLWNLGPAPVDFYGMLTGIGKNIAHQNEANLDRAEREKERQRLIAQENSAGEILAGAAAQAGQQNQTQADRLLAAGSPQQPNPRAMPTFGKIEGSQPSQNIRGVIESAAATHQLSPEYMTRMASIESGGDPNARNPSGAAGLFQFVPGTWKQYGGNASPFDPAANATAAAAFTKDNQNTLRQQLGRDPSNGELYLAHQQGAGGAAGLLANPDRPAAEVVGLKAVAQNLPRGAGDPRTITAGQFASLWTSRFADLDRGRTTPIQPAPGVPAPARPAPVVAENEDQVQAAEAAMMPRPALPPMAAGRAALADTPAPGASPAGYFVPPGSGAAAVEPAAGAAVAAPPQAAPQPAAVLSQGIRAAAQSGMPPQQVALVQAMARNPRLQSMAAQIIGKYTAPERPELDTWTGQDGNRYATDKRTGQTVAIAQFAPKQEFDRFESGGVTYGYDKRTNSAAPVAGVAPPGRGHWAAPEELPAGAKGPIWIDEKNTPHAIGGSGVTVNTGDKAGTAYDNKVGGDYAETFVGMQKAGRNAAAVKNSLNLMERLVQSPNFYSGAGQEYVNASKKALAAIGVNAEGNKPNEVFDALSKRLTLDVLGGNLGAGVSNTDVSFITSTSPSLTATKEGNLALIDMHRKVQDRQAQVAQMAREYVADPSHPRLDAGFDQQLAQFSQENPIFAPQEQERIAKLAGGAKPDAAPTKDGWRDMGGGVRIRPKVGG